MSNERYSNAKAYAAFKKVRNKLRKYPAADVVREATRILNSPSISERPNWYPRHRLLLLVKWAFIYGEEYPRRMRTFGIDELHGLLNLLSDFEGCCRMPSDFSSLEVWMKAMSHWQFPLQRGPNQLSWLRPRLLFGCLNSSDYIRREFERLTSVDLDTFLDLLALTMGYFVVNQGKPVPLRAHYFSTLKTIAAEIVEAFLGNISLRPREVKPYLERCCHVPPKSWDHELRQESPFKKRPLLHMGDAYHPYCPHLLSLAMEHWPYDLLRKNAPERFMGTFGPIFEEYIALGLGGLPLTVHRECDLRNQLLGEGKTTDFFVRDGQTNILVDAKAVVMHQLGRVTHDADVVSGKLKSSILSGVVQGNETAQRLLSLEPEHPIRIGRGNWYLLIATYDEMFIGNGADLEKIIGKQHFGSLQNRLPGHAVIPWHHVYFISAGEFDDLIACLQNGHKLSDILASAAATDTSPGGKLWTFAQHLSELSRDLRIPSYLENEFESLTDRVSAMIGETN